VANLPALLNPRAAACGLRIHRERQQKLVSVSFPFALLNKQKTQMQTISHILSLPVNNSTLDFALICAAMVAARIGLSIVIHKLNK
jgi:hypothetical protein